MRYLIASIYVPGIQAQDPAAYAVLTAATTFVIDNPTNPSAWTQANTPSPFTAMARYRSFAQMQGDFDPTNNIVHPIYKSSGWFLYDPEVWPDTPVAEQNDPWTACRHVGQFLHAKDYRVLMAPARNLGDAPHPIRPKSPSTETDRDWYNDNDVHVGFCAQHADFFDVQAQFDADVDPAPQTYHDFYAAARADVLDSASGNPYAITFAGISTAHGTSAQMLAAINSGITYGGIWLNVPDNDYVKAAAFLREWPSARLAATHCGLPRLHDSSRRRPGTRDAHGAAALGRVPGSQPFEHGRHTGRPARPRISDMARCIPPADRGVDRRADPRMAAHRHPSARRCLDPAQTARFLNSVRGHRL
jgi:hypothetical protein